MPKTFYRFEKYMRKGTPPRPCFEPFPFTSPELSELILFSRCIDDEIFSKKKKRYWEFNNFIGFILLRTECLYLTFSVVRITFSGFRPSVVCRGRLLRVASSETWPRRLKARATILSGGRRVRIKCDGRGKHGGNSISETSGKKKITTRLGNSPTDRSVRSLLQSRSRNRRRLKIDFEVDTTKKNWERKKSVQQPSSTTRTVFAEHFDVVYFSNVLDIADAKTLIWYLICRTVFKYCFWIPTCNKLKIEHF